MEIYTLILFLHVLAGAFWLGGALFAESVVAGSRRRPGESYPEAWIRVSETGGRVFSVASVIVILTALWMVTERWAFRTTWIETAIGLFVVSFVLGVGYYGPQLKKIRGLVAGQGIEASSVLAAVRRVHTVQRLEMVALVLILVMMTWKPGA